MSDLKLHPTHQLAMPPLSIRLFSILLVYYLVLLAPAFCAAPNHDHAHVHDDHDMDMDKEKENSKHDNTSHDMHMHMMKVSEFF